MPVITMSVLGENAVLVITYPGKEPYQLTVPLAQLSYALNELTHSIVT